MEADSRERYFREILEKIELYQKGEVQLDDLKRIPSGDLLHAMREECKRISRKLDERNGELRDFIRK